jgi:hypothetical protein
MVVSSSNSGVMFFPHTLAVTPQRWSTSGPGPRVLEMVRSRGNTIAGPATKTSSSKSDQLRDSTVLHLPLMINIMPSIVRPHPRRLFSLQVLWSKANFDLKWLTINTVIQTSSKLWLCSTDSTNCQQVNLAGGPGRTFLTRLPTSSICSLLGHH